MQMKVQAILAAHCSTVYSGSLLSSYEQKNTTELKVTCMPLIFDFPFRSLKFESNKQIPQTSEISKKGKVHWSTTELIWYVDAH